MTGIAYLKYGLIDEEETRQPESEEKEELLEEKQDLIDLQEKRRKSTDSASRGKLPTMEEGEPNQPST